MRSEVLALLKGFPNNSILAIGLAGLLLAGCSSSIDRFADYPGRSDGTHTASAPSRGGAASSDDYIESSTLNGAPRTASGSNPYQAPVYAKAKTYGQDQSYDQTAYDPPAPAAATRGGTIIVEPGQTLYSIGRANGMTVATLASANGIKPPYEVHAGQRIRIPGVDEPHAEAAYAPVNQNFSTKTSVHRVESGETLFSLGRSYGVHPYKIADLNDLSHNATLTVGQKVRIPHGKSAERIESEDTQTPESVEEPSERYAEEGTDQKRNLETDSENGYALPEDESSGSSAGEEQSEEQPATEMVNSFRWPVKGRVISKFGSKPGGARNEGINIAVPEGTSVRAADGGVVAYAGNELKGYGNLVLIRHDGGWVTAYAHNRQLFVKRGDTVRRGDVIAKAGQTGSVESPQLHFELRKGATAVDPLRYLTAAQASN
jgi:murein DD-endopeptidase MepM/ murein hydrolase activator NlpD